MVDATRDGIATATVTPWLAANVAGFAPPFTAEVIAGGHSNLTFKLTDANGVHYELRRPPLSHTLASAHDMGREHRIIHALRDTNVPVAPALAMCTDPAINGAPFYVMGFVDGHVVRDATIAERVLSETARRTASESLIDTMAAIHAVDLQQVGLVDLARHEGYIARQLKRWYGQFKAQKTRDLPLIDEVHDALASKIPEQGPATIVHGDYRLDNCIVNDDGRITAVTVEKTSSPDPPAPTLYTIFYVRLATLTVTSDSVSVGTYELGGSQVFELCGGTYPVWTFT